MINKTFEQCASDEGGTIYADWEQDGFRCLVMRGSCALTAYVGVKEGHPLFGKDYQSLEGNIDCHGGLTFSSAGDTYRPAGYWWIGWDYGHYGDMAFYDLVDGGSVYGWTRWCPDWVVSEFPEVIASFKNYIEGLEWQEIL